MATLDIASTVSDEAFRFERKRKAKKVFRIARCFARKAWREDRKKNHFKAGFFWIIAEQITKTASQILNATRCDCGA